MSYHCWFVVIKAMNRAKQMTQLTSCTVCKISKLHHLNVRLKNI